MFNRLPIYLFLLGLSGIHAQAVPVETVRFIGPGDNEVADGAIGCGVSFGFQKVINNVEGSSSGMVRPNGDGTIDVQTFKGSEGGNIGKGVTQRFKRKVERTPATCTLELVTDGAEAHYKKGKLINLWDEPSFSPTDVLRNSPVFPYKITFDSEYAKEAVLANFDRLADKGCAHWLYP